MNADPIAIVWGNCQSEPLAQFLTEPLAAAGLRVVKVPPVYLITEAELADVRELVSRCELLITQPVQRAYRLPGTGMVELAELVRPGARIVTVPVIYDSSEFPYQVVGHHRDGQGAFAPLTSYHDLRLMIAAERGWDADKTLEWLPGPASPDALREMSLRSVQEMREREVDLDATVSEVLASPGGMFTVNHPSNRIICHVADGVLAHLGIDARVEPPVHEELDHTRTPLEPEVLAAQGWPAELASGWIVGREPLDLREVVERHLALYADWPGIIEHARDRHAETIELLGL